jgi:hypothetical protein
MQIKAVGRNPAALWNLIWKNLLSNKNLNFAFFAFRNGCSFIGSEGRALPPFDGACDRNEAALLFRQQAIISIMNK